LKKAEKQAQSEQIEKELRLIYEDDETDFSKLEQRPHSALTRFLVWSIITLVVLSAAAWGGYLLFNQQFSGGGEKLQITIEGPDDVISGDEVQFDITYENLGDVPMALLELRLMLPDGLIVEKAEPTSNAGDNIWNVGPLTPGSDGLIRLTGIWIDSVPSSDNIQVIASYRPANFNSEFQDITTKALNVRSSALEVSSDGPTAAVPGEEVQYTFTLRNAGGIDLENPRLRLEVAEGFIVTETTPTLEEGKSEWDFEPLPPGEEIEVVVIGSFAADASDVRTMRVTSGLFHNDRFLEQGVEEAQTDVLGGGLQLRLIVNGSTDDQSVNLGTTLRLSIDVTNEGEEDVGGLQVTLGVNEDGSGVPIDWANSDTSDATRTGNTLNWSEDSLSGTGTLAGGERETIDVSLRLHNTLDGAADSMTMTVSAEVTNIAGVETSRVLQSTPITINVNSDTQFINSAHYYIEGVAVGSGPLPPEVDSTTTYRVVWDLQNSLHALEDVVITSTLPPDVVFEREVQTGIGTLDFDESTRVITWSIDSLPSTISDVSTMFDVSVTPTTDQIGTFVKLTNETVLVATDTITESRLQTSGPVLTTDTEDEEAAGLGVVVE